jgi:hypothetical protein
MAVSVCWFEAINCNWSGGIVGHVTATGQPRIALDVGDDAGDFNNPDLPHTRPEMAHPSIRRRTVGALTCKV